MKALQGKAISPGFAAGRAVVYTSGKGAVFPNYRIDEENVGSEHDRFHKAVSRTCLELEHLHERALRDLGESQAGIFAAHLGLLKDEKLLNRVREFVKRDLVNVEQALHEEVSKLAKQLNSVEDEYLRERAKDIRDVGRRLMSHLTGEARPLLTALPAETILVADELLPSDTLHLDSARVRGVVTEHGGETDHAAILARSLGIPAVSGVERATELVEPGGLLLVDGERGVVTISPTGADVSSFERIKQTYDGDSARALAEEDEECRTRDGIYVDLLANLARLEQVGDVVKHGLHGIGLLRTEFLYLDSREAPSIERQIEAYRQLVRGLPGAPINIRTLDLGGDKHPAFLRRRSEANPHLGLRGLRFSLSEQELFHTQLAAIVEVARDHPVRVLFPMVTGESDLSRAVDLLHLVAEERGVSRLPSVGAMIETPAAVFEIDEILEHCDFVSIGTNDLTQFILAADRSAAELIADYSVFHPAVLRAIRTVVDAATSAARPVGLCGEAAGDPTSALIFTGLGIRQLSMSPALAARVRYAIRRVASDETRGLLEELLKCRSACEGQSRAIRFLQSALASDLAER